MVIKPNPYSDALGSALQAVRDLASPDLLLLPVDPSDEMLEAGSHAVGLTREETRNVYMSMVHAWTRTNALG